MANSLLQYCHILPSGLGACPPDFFCNQLTRVHNVHYAGFIQDQLLVWGHFGNGEQFPMVMPHPLDS